MPEQVTGEVFPDRINIEEAEITAVRRPEAPPLLAHRCLCGLSPRCGDGGYSEMHIQTPRDKVEQALV